METLFQITVNYEGYGDYILFDKLTREEALEKFDPINKKTPPMQVRFGRFFKQTSIHQYETTDGKMKATIKRQ